MNNLKQCISELQETQSSSSIGQALREYLELVKAIAGDFTDDTTVEELRAECPELSFMDDDELEDALELAIGIRNRPKKEDGEEELNGETKNVIKKDREEISLAEEVLIHFGLGTVEELKENGKEFDFVIYKSEDAKKVIGDMGGFGLGQSQRIIIDYDSNYDKVLVRREDVTYGASKDTP